MKKMKNRQEKKRRPNGVPPETAQKMIIFEIRALIRNREAIEEKKKTLSTRKKELKKKETKKKNNQRNWQKMKENERKWKKMCTSH